MSNVFTATVAVDLAGVGGITIGDYTVDWRIFTPWFTTEELYNLTPGAIAFEGFDIGHGWFDPMIFSDMPPGFMVSSPAWVITISGAGTIDRAGFITTVSNDGSHVAVELDFNGIYTDDPEAPFTEVRSAYDWVLPNHGFYLTAVVDFVPGGLTSFPPVEVVKSGFQLHDSTSATEIVSTETPVVLTRTSGNTRYFMFPFKVGAGAAPPASNFWTDFLSCVEIV